MGNNNFFVGKRVLITGGAGFIGSNLAGALSECCDVVVIDNLSSGKIENINGLNINFIEIDVLDEKIESLLDDIDIIFHLAANVSVDTSLEDPLLDANTNILGLINLLECCRKKGVPRIVFSSSSAVYGNNVSLPTSETAGCEPDSPYGINKKMGEYYMFLYNRLYSMQNVCLRYFNVYGPKQDSNNPYSGVIAIFVNNFLNNKTITIHGDGKQTRDFIHVSDVVKANCLAAQLAKPVNKAINVGTGIEKSVADIVKALDSNYKNVAYSKPRLGDTSRSVARIDFAKEVLNFVPSVDFETGMNEYVNWIKSEPN